MELLKDLRQLRYPKEFRIEALDLFPEIMQALQYLVDTEPAEPVPPVAASSSTENEQALLKLLSNVTTHLWRLRQKMVQPGTDQPLEEMRKVYRSFEMAWDSLSGAGIEVIDHTGSPFNSGLALNVLAFQPTSGISKETVTETIRPTIYYKEQLIQRGEVIVETPEAADPAKE